MQALDRQFATLGPARLPRLLQVRNEGPHKQQWMNLNEVAELGPDAVSAVPVLHHRFGPNGTNIPENELDRMLTRIDPRWKDVVAK